MFSIAGFFHARIFPAGGSGHVVRFGHWKKKRLHSWQRGGLLLAMKESILAKIESRLDGQQIPGQVEAVGLAWQQVQPGRHGSRCRATVTGMTSAASSSRLDIAFLCIRLCMGFSCLPMINHKGDKQKRGIEEMGIGLTVKKGGACRENGLV